MSARFTAPDSMTRPALDVTTFPPYRSRRIWSIGDSLSAGNLDFEKLLFGGIGQGGIWYVKDSWQTWAMLASGARWTLGGVFATGGWTAAQILATHVPAVITAAAPGDTVVVMAGTNGNVAADVISIHRALRAAGLHTVACSIPPSTASTLSLVAAFNTRIKTFAASNGIPLVDVHALFVDPATGAYSSTYLNDGVHPNTAGYRAFGYAVATTLALVFPDPQPFDLVDHNAAMAGSFQTKPLALSTPASGTDWSTLSGIGTGTIAASANASFAGGQGYLFTVGDTTINGRLANMANFGAAGHRMRIGMALSVPVSNGDISLRLESYTTGTRWPWSILIPSGLTQAAGRFYSEFTWPAAALPDYNYRFRCTVVGSGTQLHLGEVTMLDLTALGIA